jgi:enoyl-CoA hydratase/carnithine racemase
MRIVVDFVGDRIAVVTLNRPKKANSVDAAMTEALQSAVHALEADERVDVVVLAAAGNGIFCAGADLAVVLAGAQAALFPADGGFAGFVRARRTKPWIAAVDGAALAGGFEIVLACDLVIATPRASFGLPEARWGLLAAAGGVQRLPRRLPPSIAREMILTGQPLTAEAALHHGLVNRIVPPEELISAASAMARVIAANAAASVRASVGLIRRVLDDENSEIWAETEAIGHALAGGGEAAARIGAFVNRTYRTAP